MRQSLIVARNTRCLLATGVALISVGVVHGQGSGFAPTPVRVGSVRLMTVQEHRMATGELRAVRDASIAAQEPGLVIEIPIREGEVVHTGAPLAILDSRRLELEVVRAKAQRDAAKEFAAERLAEITRQQRDIELLRRSVDQDAANPRELHDAETELAVTEARHRRANHLVTVIDAEISLLQQRVEDMTVAAPFDGIVVSREIELGEWVAEGDQVVQLVAVDRLEAWLNVHQRHFGVVASTHLPLSLNITAVGQSIAVQDHRIIPQVDSTARTFSIVASVANEDGALSPGMSLTAWIPTEQEAPRLTVPKGAVVFRDSGAFVYTVRDAGGVAQAVPIPIEILFPTRDRIVIAGGALSDGDDVIVEGNERLLPMTPVSPTRIGPTETNAAPRRETGS